MAPWNFFSVLKNGLSPLIIDIWELFMYLEYKFLIIFIICKDFLPGWLFTISTVFWRSQVLTFDEIQLIFFFLMYMFLVLLNTQDNKDILLFFFSRNVRVFGLVFTYRIIFYLIFVYGVRCDSKSIFWVCLCNCLITILKNQLKTVFEHHLHKRLFSPQI